MKTIRYKGVNMKTIRYKGELYRRVDELNSEKTRRSSKELTDLHNVLSKVYFGDVEEYLEYMAKENHDYQAVRASFREFVPAYQKFFNALRKVRS